MTEAFLPNGGARLVLRSLVTAAESVARFLRNIGVDPNPPPVAAARAKPARGF